MRCRALQGVASHCLGTTRRFSGSEGARQSKPFPLLLRTVCTYLLMPRIVDLLAQSPESPAPAKGGHAGNKRGGGHRGSWT